MSENSPIDSKIIALVGPPNTGKTTLFNWLTNSKYKTVNYPGATVEYSIATLAPHFGGQLKVMDTPGTYSLSPKGEDEEVTVKALFNPIEGRKIDGIVVVVDATQLARQLVFVLQLIESGFSVIVALTMSDLIRKMGNEIQIESLSEALGCPIIPIDGILGGGVRELVEAMKSISQNQLAKKNESQIIRPISLSSEIQTQFIKKSENLVRKYSQVSKGEQRRILLDRTRKWDQVLLHPFFGLLIFIFVMTMLFTSIFTVAAPFMDMIDSFFSFSSSKLAEFGQDQLWSDFLGNGVIASFGAVLVFVPQIFILFFLIGFLEASGYLSRAATLIDRPLSFFGMSGRSFVPILSAFACSVPALMACRNISSKRDRFITMMIIPLMTCSARLPVYALLLAFLFRGRPGWQAGLGLSLMYFGAIVVGGIVSQILHRMLKLEKNSFFMMELPLYRRPLLKVVFQQAWTKTFGYIKRAGPPIFIFALLIWALTTFPNFKAENDQLKLETSYAGQAGQFIEPVFKPMGVDWRVGVALISAFAAREVFASSLAVIFNVTANDDDGLQQGLMKSMTEATHSDGSLIFTGASVIGLLVFVMIALQCTSTTAMVIRETGKVSWAIGQVVIYNIMAYVFAVGIYQLWS